MKKLIILFSLLALILPSSLNAQADISMSTDWYNRGSYNPASIARPDYIYLFSNVRKQWMGVEGSPTTMNIQVSGLNYEYKSAFGLSLINDYIGATQYLNPMVNYAYVLRNIDDHRFTLGIAAGVFARKFDFSKFDALDASDQALYTDLNTTIRPDVNIGFEYQNPALTWGVSSTHILSYGNASDAYKNSTHLYSYLIYKNTSSNYINFNAGCKVVSRYTSTVWDANLTLRFKHDFGLEGYSRELFDVGLTYRSAKQLILLTAINLSNNFRIGYAFDQSFSTGYNANSTHEIMLEYRIPSKKASSCNCKNESDWYF